MTEPAAHTGVMIGCFLAPDTAARLAIVGGEAAADLHLTLVFLGSTDDLDAMTLARAMVVVQQFASSTRPLKGTISGYGRFLGNEDGKDVFYASVDAPGIEDLQDDLCDALERTGTPYAATHGFTPHITLKYLDPGADNPPSPPTIPITLDALTFCAGDTRTTVPFANPATPMYFNADQQEQSMTDTIASFALPDGTADGDFVVRRGKVFECGDYPDKRFSLTAEEAKAAVAAFAPVPNDLEHRPTILSGHLGELTDVSVGDDGTSLMGSVRIPRWLHDAIGAAPLKTSLAWDIASKRIIKNGLVIEPRVPDAALFTAYAEFAGARHSKADQDTVQALHDHAVSLGAACPSQARMSKETGMADQKGTTAPTRMERFMAWLGGEGEADAQFAADAPKQAETPRIDATPDAETIALRAQVAVMQKERLAEKAATFADGEIAAKRALPAERDAIVAAFADAAEDDAAHPRTVTFSVDGAEKTGTRVDALAARYAARPPHVLTEELLADTDAQALFNRARTAKDGEMSAERRKELLSKTALGQAIVAVK